MKKITSLIVFVVFLFSCSGVKQTQSMLNDGNYDGAISKSIDNLKSNKNSKGKQDYVYLLEEAFSKAKKRDLEAISIWEKEGNPNHLEKIYNTYIKLQNRQEKIQPLLPLTLIKEGRNAQFSFEDYSTALITTKSKLSDFLYENALKLMKTKDKISFRRAFDDFEYLNTINPGYKDCNKLMDECHLKGTDFVHVYTKNETNMVIPSRLQNDLLDFSTLGLNDKWTIYHSNKQKNTNYDFAMVVSFRGINISPEKVFEREFSKEKLIKNGTKPQLNSNGQPVKDEKGNTIMIDNMITVRSTVYEFRQNKSCSISAKIDYLNLNTNQLINTFPITSNFVFENIYANYNGDPRACDENYLPYFNRRPTSFPTNEQMIYDSGEDLKNKLKSTITRNRLRR
ncbi:hypothetical protein AX766_12405 [Flavobacterium covae]|uniref:Lipoprotein n=1 Tax=Flavobacterium covae TaxID=2906076 RepID=A0ABW8PEM1_9FLAO|nr:MULTISPECIES: hypothetical protein [Flavobacterium]OXA81241.1 hypothetical protein B0A56_06055 [Flavobacterium columnare NBRC 100251 = ATCC 23463]AND65124.1 hypothetical protein AX766_12405 [Flavobacterium covae]MCJ1805410.1 hypothetical protein [Flavobacterium covae]OWP80973.1 hypothetical protein BWK63_08245 [Flavobacterium covae]POR21521.1 hypothetical protein BWK57_09670 [Flavobacterium columnare]